MLMQIQLSAFQYLIDLLISIGVGTIKVIMVTQYDSGFPNSFGKLLCTKVAYLKSGQKQACQTK